MKTTTELITLLEKRFPNAWFKEGVEFQNGYEKSVWTGEGSYIGKGEKVIPMFDSYEMGKNYEFGAHIQLCRFVEKYGYFVECYDGGTFFIWQD
jgi:hypothetical protein